MCALHMYVRFVDKIALGDILTVLRIPSSSLQVSAPVNSLGTDFSGNQYKPGE